MDFNNIIEEFKRRKALKAALAYLAVAWILLQVFSILLPMVDSPKWVLKSITIIMFIGFLCWLPISWKYQITTEGIKKNEGINYNGSKGSGIIYGLIILLIIAPLAYIVLRPENKKATTENQPPITILADAQIERRSPTTNLIALDFYKRGEFYHKKQSLAEIDLAIDNYLKAIENDSLFAMAYSSLASAYMRKNLSFDPDIKWEEEAYAAAGKALQLDPDLASPHIIQGQFYWSPSHNFAHEDAIREFNKAIIKDSTISQAFEQLSLVQLHIGLFDKAQMNAQRSIFLDPANYRTRRFIGEILLFQGEYKDALEEFNKIPKTFAPEPTQAFKALTFYHLNQTEKAIELIEENLSTYPHSPHINSVYAIILASRGEKEEALNKIAIARENTHDFIHAHHIYYYFGVASAILGEKKESLDWLQKAAITGFPNYPLYNSDPDLQSLKESEGFRELLLNLKEDWENYKAL
jgi:tetratricopeptide (TPR) repeat protein